MNRRWLSVVVLLPALPALCPGQPPGRPGDRDRNKPAALAAAEAAARDVAENLRDAREAVKQISDKRARQQLELLLTRAELRNRDVRDNLAALEGPARPVIISDDDFARLLRGLAAGPFDNDRVTFVENFARARTFTSAHVREIARTFQFDDGRGKAAVLLYPRVVDPENFFTVLEVFTFDANRKAVREKLKLK
jgi:hypothetical protein